MDLHHLVEEILAVEWEDMVRIDVTKGSLS